MTENEAELPGRVRAELTRLRAEREVFTAEQDRLKRKLADTEYELRTVTGGGREDLASSTERVAELGEKLERGEADRAELAARVSTLDGDIATVRAERDSLRAELAGCRTERDELRLRVLDAELALAAGQFEPVASTEPAEPVASAAAERRAAEIAAELDAHKQTVSWRVTAPLRAVRTRLKRS
ncbi:hypothetical protein CFN78_27300 [Amycolatopsis antarctica]|uniref:Chromosome partition protein Smc n=1 Tax=Amycolatopsis antarctica TaxID=1854586 RepID=A0A263CV86_9PSEU|nr:hypothetical protein [Amycolatopsis antarctica]OZM70042.1 hypothetical protein CFN78_27300 [Amycolatopsis antarctica]